jgi:hypothetical protein
MQCFLEHDDKEKLTKSMKIEELKNRHTYYLSANKALHNTSFVETCYFPARSILSESRKIREMSFVFHEIIEN